MLNRRFMAPVTLIVLVLATVDFIQVALADPTSDPRPAATQPARPAQPLPPAAAAMPRLPVTEQMGISQPGSESRQEPEVVRPTSPARATEPNPRAVIDWLLHPSTR